MSWVDGAVCRGWADEPTHLRDYVETQLAPTLQKGDVVILDNLRAHKSQVAEKTILARGAWILFLPPYSPDLNPIEMAFAKLKALLRKRAVRTIEALWAAIGASAIRSHLQNAETTSRQQAMNQPNRTTL